MNIDEAFNKLEAIDKELIKIFDLVTSEKEIAYNKSFLLRTKVDILSDILEDTTLSLIQESFLGIEKTLKYQKLISVLFIVSFALIFVNLYLGIGLNVIRWILKFRVNEQLNEKMEFMRSIDPLADKAVSLEIVIENCYRFLDAKTNNNLELEEELNDIELRKIILANETIEIAISNGTTANLPDGVKDLIVQMLQMELQTTEDDLEKLMQMAAEKAKEHTSENVRTRTRMSKKDEK